MKGVGKHGESTQEVKTILKTGENAKNAFLEDGGDRAFKTNGIKGIGKNSNTVKPVEKDSPVKSGYFRGEEPFENIKMELGEEAPVEEAMDGDT